MPTPPHRPATKAKTKAKPVGMPITQAAEHLGISAGVLRVWEDRYGWPRPARKRNGYRVYPASLIAVLERVSTELKLGKSIGDLMRDPWWQRVFETGELPKPPPPRVRIEPPWSTLPMPASARGRDVRQKLQQALITADSRLARWAQAIGQQLRPEERETAVKMVLRLWHQHRADAPPLEDMRLAHGPREKR